MIAEMNAVEVIAAEITARLRRIEREHGHTAALGQAAGVLKGGLLVMADLEPLETFAAMVDEMVAAARNGLQTLADGGDRIERSQRDTVDGVSHDTVRENRRIRSISGDQAAFEHCSGAILAGARVVRGLSDGELLALLLQGYGEAARRAVAMIATGEMPLAETRH